MAVLQISACTYRRPEGLRALFASLAAMHLPAGVAVSLCIVDNDTLPSAQALVGTLGASLDFEVRYVHEARPGIPMARNRALALAGDADYVAFIDDDETVEPDWLVELWAMARCSGAHFVQGPVIMQVKSPHDQWWLETVFFRLRSFPDGAPRSESWTNNVLIDMAFVREKGLCFDERLALDGGEDTLFFQDMVRSGGRGVFALKARVRECQPPARLNWSWGMQRQYRTGVTRANTVRLRRSRPVALAYCLVRSAAMAAVGCSHLLTCPLRGRRGLANGIALLCRSAGILLGAFGARHLEYGRGPGAPAGDKSTAG